MLMTIGQHLRMLRERDGLTQEDVGNQLNVSRQVISKWELEKSLPDLKQIASLAELYQISLDELILGRKTDSSENNYQQLAQEWQRQANALPRITLEDYWMKGPNLQLTHLGKRSQLQMTLTDALGSGQVIGTVFLVAGEYFPSNTIGNNGPKCQIELTQEGLTLSEFNTFFIGWRRWPKKVPKIRSLLYQEIKTVVIGVERRTGKNWGLNANGQPSFSLLIDVYLQRGEHWIFSCASLNLAPNLLEYFCKNGVKVNDLFKLVELFNNSHISEPSNYLKENFERLIPATYRAKYDQTL